MPVEKSKKPLVLYVAPAETVPGSVGGSVHVEEVALGLARLGYRVEIIARKVKDLPPTEELERDVRIHRLVPKYPVRFLLWMAKKYVMALARELEPDYIVERYYNFGGAGVLTGRKLGIPVMLEVNSPTIDHPRSLKAFLDRLLIIKPMKKYREFLCCSAADIISPLTSIVPPVVPVEKVHKVDWGAAVERFRSTQSKKEARSILNLSADDDVLVFLGSFRKWHGVWDLATAIQNIAGKNLGKNLISLMVGGGPEFKKLKKWVKRKGLSGHFLFTGSVEHSEVPLYLAAADAGVAPFNPALHSQLKLGFYWSPLKIFEYMAASLPVITIDVPPLNGIIRGGVEGLLYPAGDAAKLADAICNLIRRPEAERKKMGERAFKRVSERYSWEMHCRNLDLIIKKSLKTG